MGQREWARLAFEVARGDTTSNDGEKEPLPTSREAISREKLMHSSVKSSIISIFSKTIEIAMVKKSKAKLVPSASLLAIKF